MTETSPREGTVAARRARVDGRPLSSTPSARRAFKWLDARSLWKSRNDLLARFASDPTDELRRAWMGRLDGDPVIDDHRARPKVSFALVGDPGEGDASQAAVARPLMTLRDECDFMVICSDVNYPIGDVNEYAWKFYEPYAAWTRPIYALPGNHDWYDEAHGFMFHFCGMDPPAAARVRRPPLWRRPRPVKGIARERRATRPAGRGGFQPAPYFLIDTGPLALVGIDTGIRGHLDRDQGDWLLRVSRDVRKPKVLLTGKPLIVDGAYHPGKIEGAAHTVDDIVREPAHGYVAAIGGDIHNYQRYPATLDDGRHMEYIVSGGGGAFMHATHRIARVDIAGVDEDRFRCFPLRGDSLWFYACTVIPALLHLWLLSIALPVLITAAAVGAGLLLGGGWCWLPVGLLAAGPLLAACVVCAQVTSTGGWRAWGLRKVTLTPEQASAYMAEQLGLPAPTVSGPTPLSPRQRALAEFVRPRAGAGRGVLHTFFSEIFDVDTPPMYKQFLRLDADADTLRVTCHAAIGDTPPRPYVEEVFDIDLRAARAAVAGQPGSLSSDSHR